jgi:hypothetical protein
VMTKLDPPNLSFIISVIKKVYSIYHERQVIQ